MQCRCGGLTWHDVGWRVRAGGVEQQMLWGITGHAPSGEVLAVMGPSGSGKTTLLDILAMRKTLGKAQGEVRVDGRERRPGAFQRASAFIPHEDAFLPTLTVSETMRYHAEMCMPSSASTKARQARVAECLTIVGLQKAGATMVGGTLPGGLSLRGLSGGEKKRLGIAAAMLPEPLLVFADEPSSGLDSLASLRVLQALRDVAARGRVVVVTVHQPRGPLWRLFDRLCLLSEGRLMYCGRASEAVEWFGSLGYEAPPGASPADWLLDLVAVGFDKSSLGCQGCRDAGELEEASRRFAESERMRGILAEVRAACGGGGEDGQVGLWPWAVEAEDAARRLPSTMAQCRTLMWRHALNYSRNVGNVAARLCLSAASGLIVGLCYSGLRAADADDPRIVPDRLGALFFVCIVLMITPNCTMTLFVADRRFYVAEAARQLYGPLAYYLPFALCELALNLAAVTLFWVPVSALSGMQQGALGFGRGLLVCSLVQLCGAQITNFSALLMPSQELAFVASVAANVVAFVTSGFLVRTADLMACVRWLRFLSPVKLGFQALAVNELASREFGTGRQLEALRVALREAGSGCKGKATWWLRQAPLRGLAEDLLEELMPCADPCVTGMVASGREALGCLGLQEPEEVLPAALGLAAQLLALHAAGWLCLRHLQRESR